MVFDENIFEFRRKFSKFFQYFRTLFKNIFDEIRKYRKFSSFSNIYEHYLKIFSTKFENFKNYDFRKQYFRFSSKISEYSTDRI